MAEKVRILIWLYGVSQPGPFRVQSPVVHGGACSMPLLQPLGSPQQNHIHVCRLRWRWTTSTRTTKRASSFFRWGTASLRGYQASQSCADASEADVDDRGWSPSACTDMLHHKSFLTCAGAPAHAPSGGQPAGAGSARSQPAIRAEVGGDEGLLCTHPAPTLRPELPLLGMPPVLHMSAIAAGTCLTLSHFDHTN